jgi:alkaline phosphatase
LTIPLYSSRDTKSPPIEENWQVRYKTIAEYAHEAGMKVGVVSTVTLDHATPAGFFAKVPSRSNYYDIAVQMVESGFEYFGGGGLLQPTGQSLQAEHPQEPGQAGGPDPGD